MARLARLSVPGVTQHVIQRGNNRQAIFFEREDYRLYLALLREFSAAFSCDIHAYVLMTNHVHLLVTPQQENGLSQMMQFIGRRYVRHVNDTYQRSGTLWEGRFRASMLDSDAYLMACMRYIELNPLRARMVRKVENYPWSSYHRNALGERSELIRSHDLYVGLGPTPELRQKAYAASFRTNADDDMHEEIRKATQGGWALGPEKFQKQIAKVTKSRVTPLPRGGDRRSEKFGKQKRVSI